MIDVKVKIGTMESEVRVNKADIEKCKDLLDFIELVSGEWLKQHQPPLTKYLDSDDEKE